MLHIDGKQHDWSTIDLGTGDGLEDNRSIKNGYHNFKLTSEVARDRTNLVVGAKGTGKTHLFVQLAERFKKKPDCFVISILEDESHKILDLFTRIAESKPAIGAIAFEGIWETFLLSQAVEQLRDLTDFRRSRYFADIDSYFEVDSDNRLYYRVKNLTEKIVSEGQETPDQDLLDILQGFEASDEFTEARAALRAYLEEDYEGTIVILIDGLDQGISNDSNSSSERVIEICKGLYLALTRLKATTYSSKLQIKACLPSDIFFHFNMRDGDKFERAHKVDIQWNNSLLTQLLNRRLNASLNIGLEKDTVSKVLPRMIQSYFYNLDAPQGHQLRERSTFDVILEYTFFRPRDVITICNEIFSAAAINGVDRIGRAEVRDGINSWASSNYEYLIAEASFSDPRIATKLATFSGKHQAYKYSEFIRILSEKDLAMGMEARMATFDILYKLGLIGIGIRKAITSRDDSNATFYNVSFSFHGKAQKKAAVGKMSDLHIIYFHPALTIPLMLNPGLSS